MERVLVIGSNSFSGGDFVDLLLEQKKYEVIGVSRSPEKSPLFLPYYRHGRERFSFHQLDLNNDSAKLVSLIDELQPAYIVNFAAQSEVAPSWEHPDHWFETNVVALAKLLNPFRSAKFIKRYVGSTLSSSRTLT